LAEWDENLSIGVLEIDIQHKLLFEKYNAFLAACHAEMEADAIYRLLWFVEAYALTHFREEEDLMQRIGYPDYQIHREQHLKFCEDLGKLKESLRNDGPTQNIMLNMSAFISRWLIDHISNMDMAIGRFMADG
jgi:hemerythrin